MPSSPSQGARDHRGADRGLDLDPARHPREAGRRARCRRLPGAAAGDARPGRRGRFLRAERRAILLADDDPAALLDALAARQPPAPLGLGLDGPRRGLPVGAEHRVARLDHPVDQGEPSSNGESPFIASMVAQPCRRAHPRPRPAGTPAERGLAHEPVVGVHRHAEAEPGQQADGVVGDRGHRSHVDVRGRAQLQGAPAGRARRPPGGPRAWPPSPSAAMSTSGGPRAPGARRRTRAAPRRRREPEGLAGVDRDVEVVAHHAREGVQVARGRVARLGAGDVEAADALVAVAQRQLGDLEAARLLAHGRAEHPHGQLAARGAALEAGQDRLDDLVEARARPRCAARGRSGSRRRRPRRRRGPRRTRRPPAPAPRASA